MDESNKHYIKLTEVFAFFEHHPSPKYGRGFNPRSEDIFITTYPKCGTTWVTQICHQLRSGGHMDFKEVAQVAPWDVMAQTVNQDLDADQTFHPRLFKSHETYNNIAKGGKYVVVVRHPYDALSSFYKFSLGLNQIPLSEYSIEQFFDTPVVWGSFTNWYAGWYTAWTKGEVNVLWVFYEDLKENAPREVTRIAEFMGIDKNIRENRIEVALKNSSLEFMAKHGDKFNEAFVMNALSDSEFFTGPPTAADKVVAGKVGQGKKLPDNVIKGMDEQWKQNIEKTLGFKNYAEFKQAVQS